MKVIFFEVEELESKLLLQLYGDVDYDTVTEPLNTDNVVKYADAEVISSFIYSDLGAKTLKQMKNLKCIATRSRNYDHIDLDYCRDHNIVVAHVPAYGEHTVAEHAFSLLLALNRQIPRVVQQVREGNFSLRDMQGFDLYGKTIGIIGTGAIGLHMIGIARGFGMRVLGYDLYPKEADIAEAAGFTYTSLENLLSQSDIISIHTSATGKALLADREFAMMKQGVVIINTAHGAAINAKALLQALSKGVVRAAGLDVLPDEPAIRDDAEFLRASFSEKHDAHALLTSHALLRHKNVIITPHSAFYTKETVETILRTTGDNIRAFMRGEQLNRVLMPVQVKKRVNMLWGS